MRSYLGVDKSVEKSSNLPYGNLIIFLLINEKGNYLREKNSDSLKKLLNHVE